MKTGVFRRVLELGQEQWSAMQAVKKPSTLPPRLLHAHSFSLEIVETAQIRFFSDVETFVFVWCKLNLIKSQQYVTVTARGLGTTASQNTRSLSWSR